MQKAYSMGRGSLGGLKRWRGSKVCVENEGYRHKGYFTSCRHSGPVGEKLCVWGGGGEGLWRRSSKDFGTVEKGCQEWDVACRKKTPNHLASVGTVEHSSKSGSRQYRPISMFSSYNRACTAVAHPPGKPRQSPRVPSWMGHQMLILTLPIKWATQQEVVEVGETGLSIASFAWGTCCWQPV